MSVQPLCRKPEDLVNFSFKEFQNKFYKSVKRLAKKHNDIDCAAPCYLSLEENFSDKEKEFLLVFGKFSKWKNYARAKAKSSAALYGLCYITEDEDSNALIINIVVSAGKIKSKEMLIAKALKGIISPSRCKIKISAIVLTEEMLRKLEAKTESMDEVIEEDEEEDTTKEKPVFNNTTKNTSAENNTNSATENKGENTNEEEKDLTPAQAKKIQAIRADIAAIKNLLEQIDKCETKAELKTLDEAVLLKFAPYGSKKTS